jgi:hypothetical protein
VERLGLYSLSLVFVEIKKQTSKGNLTMSGLDELLPLIDNGGRRSYSVRRRYPKLARIPERRTYKDRRINYDRRKTQNKRRLMGLERREVFG